MLFFLAQEKLMGGVVLFAVSGTIAGEDGSGFSDCAEGELRFMASSSVDQFLLCPFATCCIVCLWSCSLLEHVVVLAQCQESQRRRLNLDFFLRLAVVLRFGPSVGRGSRRALLRGAIQTSSHTSARQRDETRRWTPLLKTWCRQKHRQHRMGQR